MSSSPLKLNATKSISGSEELSLKLGKLKRVCTPRQFSWYFGSLETSVLFPSL